MKRNGLEIKHNLGKYFHFEFNRLSILDLSEDADQPMYSESFDNMLMFNGEIYNHQELRKNLESSGAVFKTSHSDTEVILNGLSMHGLKFIEKLNGQFSIFFLDLKIIVPLTVEPGCQFGKLEISAITSIDLLSWLILGLSSAIFEVIVDCEIALDN